jgi:Zn-dependent protease/CBS domain-containing protein
LRNWSVSIATLFGVEVRVHLTFLLLLAFLWLTQAAAPHGASPERALALAGMVFGSVVMHELGHALAARRDGWSPRSIILLPVGGVTLLNESERSATTVAQEVRAALAGPAVNLTLAGVAAAAILVVAPQDLLSPPWIDSSHLLRALVWMNIFLGLLNLLPAYPLDGGRVLRAWFLRRFDPAQATRRALSLGQFFSTAFLLAGMAAAIYGREWSYWLMLLGFFLFVGGQLEDRSAIFRAVLETVRMEDVMLTDFATLSPADTLEAALSKAVHTLQDDFPVIRGSELVGVISRQRILENLRREGNGYIQAAMSRIFEVAQRHDSLATAFRKITRQGATLIPVVDGEHMVGIVTLQNLMHSMALLAETRKLQRAESNREIG